MIRTVAILLFVMSLQGIAHAQDAQWNAGKLSVTHHQFNTAAGSFTYTATAGYMPVKDEKDSLKAKLFFVSYTRDGVANTAKRPVLFAFNGGPGSSSVWLHMGLIGPERVLMTDSGTTLPPPYQYVPNDYSWLDKTDLVFIDPMLTGFTRPNGNTQPNDYTGFNNDIHFVGDFIRLYLSRFNRWNSPKFLAGESYGTTRAAGLSNYLEDAHGIYLNGIVLLSAVLNFGTLDADRGNDMPYALHLPTFAATAWYHKQTDPKYTSLKDLIRDVNQYALGDYNNALLKGDRLTPAERSAVIDRLHSFTGLSKAYIDASNLRLSVGRFNKELLRMNGKTVGRYDTRITGTDYDNAGESYEYDPSYNETVRGSFTATFNDYIRRDLHYESDLPYEILTGRVWPWHNSENEYLNVAESLRSAMVKNPYLKVWICNGYYDLATPYFATDYTVHHMFLPPALQQNIKMTYYQAGHMMYLHKPSLVKLRKDFDSFVDDALSNTGKH